MFRFTASLALAAATTSVAHAVAFFPNEPGPQDPIYLLYNDPCETAPPIGRPTLTRINSTGGWRFDLKHNNQIYVCDLPISGGNTYAFEIPRQVNGHDVGVVEVVEHLVVPLNNAIGTFTQTLPRPRGRAREDIPVSVSGTWTLDGAKHQGLLITMDPARRITVGFNTFDAAGRPAWFTGLAQPEGPRVTVPMMEVPAGTFAGTPGVGPLPRAWGELDLTFETCGRMSAAWRPLASTGLPSGVGTIRQLTSPYNYECDLEAYAAYNRTAVVLTDYGIVE